MVITFLVIIKFLALGALFLGAYLVGSIPSGYWFAKYFYKIDVTLHGSGNIGATNVARVLASSVGSTQVGSTQVGSKFFFLIFFFDAAKAYFFLFLSRFLLLRLFDLSNILFLLVVAVLLLLGNGCSVFIGFRGGKGVATAVGLILFLFPMLALCFLVVWGILLACFKRVFIASLVGLASLIILYPIVYTDIDWQSYLFLLLLVVWVVVRHKKNIMALLSGDNG